MVPSAAADWLTAQTERGDLAKQEEEEAGMKENRLMKRQNVLLESASF